ncbi:MAG: methylated-DNA--[protein]-cysteine S-methyltransferase [Bacteroides sp.]|nr:methylated-DNA--[protein]-cysteine S-methyltransferase [Bacteroides sp.]
MDIITDTYSAPCGTLTLGSFGDRLCLCEWRTGRSGDAILQRLSRNLNATFTDGRSDVITRAVTLLDQYFAGECPIFDIPLLFAGTDFQMSVWNELMNIPYGTTLSYAELSRRIGRPTAMRAVANANGANAISIFAPCHRVIGADGSLTGYGGGLDAKRFLLNLESNITTHI